MSPGATGASVFGFAPPVAVLREERLLGNIEVFHSYCRAAGVELAPHVKTTMCRELVSLQLEHGAWGATVASVAQARVVHAWGVRRILIANEITDPASLDWLLGVLPDGSEIYCWIDSIQGARLLAERWRAAAAAKPVPVLIELGHTPAGRTGVRSDAAALELARHLHREPAARLAGVAAYEGTLRRREPDRVGSEVDALLARMDRLARACAQAGWFSDEQPPILSAGGSAYFDRVIAGLASALESGFALVLRSGCYLTHDCGSYDDSSPLGSRRGGGLLPALEVWGPVLSTPEPGLAIAGIGKRDASHDLGLPTAIRLRGRDGRVQPLDGLTSSAIDDQHIYLLGPTDRLRCGDLIGFGISHPCTTFDKWRELALVDEDYRVKRWVQTDFH